MHSSENSTPNSSSDSPCYYKTQISSPSEPHVNGPWYHGELDEADATQLLQAAPTGTFLVRKRGHYRFYLSFVDKDKRVKHSPIRQINSSYFLDGLKFESLLEIIENFELAKYPLRRMENESCADYLEIKYVCIRSYEPGDVEYMSADRGDIVSVYETDDDDWLMGRNETTGAVGLIPVENLEPLVLEVEDMNELPYFYDTILTDAIHLNPIGSFLLRKSSKGTDTYALLVKTQYDLVEKFLIVGSPSRGFSVAGRQFPTIGHVLNRYCDRAISGGVRLTHAVCIEKPENASNDELMTMSQQFDDRSRKRADREDAYSENVESVTNLMASTSAMRKSREDKHWKECYLTLSDLSIGASHLSIFDSAGSKRRQCIDLSSSTILWLDESVFAADGCVYISPSFPHQPSVYLCFRPFSNFLHWIKMLRQRSIFQDSPPPISQLSMSYTEFTTQMSILFVDIEKYRSDALKSDNLYSVNVLLNGTKICASPSFAPAANRSTNEMPVVVIDSRFVLPCIPVCHNGLQLSMLAHSPTGKRGRPCGVSPLISLPEGENSVAINHVPQSDVGFTFRVLRQRFPVLSIERYAPLIDEMRGNPSELFRWPAHVLPQQHKLFLYTCISYLFSIDSSNMAGVFRKIIADVLSASTPEDVFRKDSLATGIVTQTLRQSFNTPLYEFLHENSTFLQANSNGGANMESVVEILVDFVDEKLVTLPVASKVLAIAAACAQHRFESEPHLVKRTLSALLVLRVLNPVIFSSLSGSVGSQLAKAVQSCAKASASLTSDANITTAACTMRRMFDRVIANADDQMIETSGQSAEAHTEWLACISHLIGFSLTLKPSGAASASAADVGDHHVSMPLPLFELIRLHQ
ncbi:unnamed protein product [Caenorhabditis bovis]|uniref:Uncharacterized protein n=1 Tax=Caenorhabditis bovis TaxID=2654633 RepID=A0A8S1F3X2_9PELO|nr:unnamed protein product [Caenorhabditis bovis]